MPSPPSRATTTHESRGAPLRYRATLVVALAACAPAIDAECPTLRIRFDGQCCAPWTVADLDVCILSSWETPTDADSVGPRGARDPEVAVDRDGRIVLTWMEATQTSTSIAAAHEREDGTFALMAPAQALAGNGTSPSLATDTQGRALLSWRQHKGPDTAIYYAERDPNPVGSAPGQWRSPNEQSALSYGPAAYEPRSLYTSYGEAMVVFNQWTGEHFGVVAARRDATTPSQPLSRPTAQDVLSPPVLFANAPAVAVASNGDAIITWYQSIGQGLMTFVSERFGADGEFSRPAPNAFISATGAPVDSHPEANPAPAIDARGAAAITWTQQDGQSNTPVYLATRDGWGAWTTPAGLDDTFSMTLGAARCPQTAFGGDGSLYVTWYEEDVDQRLRVFAAYRAPDETWIEPGRDAQMLSGPGLDAVHPVLAVGDEGEAVLAYAQREGGRWDIVVRRRNPGGGAWLAPEVLSAQLTGDASEPTIARQDDTFAVAWTHGELLNGQVHVARVLPRAP